MLPTRFNWTRSLQATATLLTCLILSLPGFAQTENFNRRLDQAVQNKDWAEAIEIVDQMIEADSSRQADLEAYRQSLVELEAGSPHSGSAPSSASSSTGSSNHSFSDQPSLAEGGTRMPQVLVDQMTEGCITEGLADDEVEFSRAQVEATCQCVAEGIQDEYSFEQMLALGFTQDAAAEIAFFEDEILVDIVFGCMIDHLSD